MEDKYTVADFISELFLGKPNDTLKFVLETEDGNMVELNFDSVRHNPNGRMFVFKEEPCCKEWRELISGDDGK